ncbi:MAG: polymer-forming cytoskeletal protein [Acidobacteriota bacterium]
MNLTDSATLIGRSMKIRGELSGTDDMHIDGEVEGLITLPGARLTIGSEGRVRAALTAQDIVIAGKVQGEIRATGAVRLLETAVVLGDITALRFSMEENAVLRGKVEPGRGTVAEPVVAAATTEVEPVEVRPHGHLPAALAVAARQFEEAAATETSAAAGEHDVNSGDSTELAETQV